MNRHDRRRARSCLECSAGGLACPEAGRLPVHAPADCDGSCHTAAELAAYDLDVALRRRGAGLRVALRAAVMYPAEAFEGAPDLVRGAALVLVLTAVAGRDLAALYWLELVAVLTGVPRRAERSRLALEAWLLGRRARAPRRLLACLDHVTVAPRTGPPAGAEAASSLFCRAGGAVLICT